MTSALWNTRTPSDQSFTYALDLFILFLTPVRGLNCLFVCFWFFWLVFFFLSVVTVNDVVVIVVNY